MSDDEKAPGKHRARIFKLLRSPGIDSNEPISPGCVAWRAGTTTHPTRFLAHIDCLKIYFSPQHPTLYTVYTLPVFFQASSIGD
jgi:hypothetical protein